MVTLEKKRIMYPYEMECGQIGEILNHLGNEAASGKIVQRHGDLLIVIGEREGARFSTLMGGYKGMTVRLLEVGEQIFIKSN